MLPWGSLFRSEIGNTNLDAAGLARHSVSKVAVAIQLNRVQYQLPSYLDREENRYQASSHGR